MEKLLSISAGAIVGYSFYEMYNYYTAKQIEHKLKPAVSIDLSYEEIPENMVGKHILLATSIETIDNDIENKILSKRVEESGVRDNLLRLKNLNQIKLRDIDIEPSKRVIFIDPPVIKSQSIDKNTKLNLVEKMKYLLLSRYCEKLYLLERGVIKNQRILVYGKIYKNHKLSIKPEILIGSGIVEFEELIEYTKNKLNTRLFNITVCLFVFSFLHFSYKNLTK
jgi:hypothetical protein